MQINGVENQRLTKKTRKNVKMGQQSTRQLTTADESPEAASNDTSAGDGAWIPQFKPAPLPSFPAPSGEPLHQSTLPCLPSHNLAQPGTLHRTVSSRRIQADPRFCERRTFREVPLTDWPRIRPLPNLLPPPRDHNQSSLCCQAHRCP